MCAARRVQRYKLCRNLVSKRLVIVSLHHACKCHLHRHLENALNYRRNRVLTSWETIFTVHEVT